MPAKRRPETDPGVVKKSRQLLKEATGEDFNPQYYIDYLTEKFTKLYGLEK